MTLLKSPKTNR